MQKVKEISTLYIIFTIVAALINGPGAIGQNTDTAKTVIQALKMVNSPEPVFKPYKAKPLSPAELAEISFEQVYKSTPVKFVMRDGKYLSAQKFPIESNTTILLLHGVLSSSYTMNKMAGLLREAINAEVIALDLRGHGQSEGKPGDVDYIGQYADDVADVLAIIKKEHPGNRIILAAHSMGGGIALLYAMKKNVTPVNGYLLFAPLLGQNTPTIPQAPKKIVDTGADPFLMVDISRIIGLKMLNSAGNHNYDYLPVLFFNLPATMPFRNYTYRADESMEPADYKEGLKAVNVPLHVIVGSNDEAFKATAFKPAITAYSEGGVTVIADATHNGVRQDPRAIKAAKTWAESFNLSGTKAR